jgi:hypothetical protein
MTDTMLCLSRCDFLGSREEGEAAFTTGEWFTEELGLIPTPRQTERRLYSDQLPFDSEDDLPPVKIARRRGKRKKGHPLPEPTKARPGTPEKVAVLEARARLRQCLWHPCDAGLGGSSIPVDEDCAAGVA